MTDHSHEAQESLRRLREGLKEVVALSGRELQGLSEEIGRSPGYLGKVLNGHLKLKVRELFEILRRLHLRPEDFFNLYFPLGGPLHARLRLKHRGGAASIWGPRPRIAGPVELNSEQLAVKTARRLRGRLRMSGVSQRAMSRRLGLSQDALGLALRGNTRLSFRHVFEVLAAIRVRPERFFAELLGPEDGDLVATLRWSQVLDEVEAHLVGTVEALEARRLARKGDAPSR